jgi:cytochrome c
MENMRNRILLALAFTGLAAAPALAQDDLAAEGEKVFKRCAACHMVGPDAKNRVGPELNGIVGRTAGTLEGFSYSKAMVEAGAGGLVWNEETLDAYLADPKGMVKGTKMAFAGLKSEEDRQAVIAYLAAQGGAS